MNPARILVVDDEPGMVRVVERILGGRHQVLGLGSAREALAAMESFRPDLALLDIRLPEIDGFELTSRLKEINPDIDVILMTGSLSDPDQKLVQALRRDAFYFIQKPFDREVLNTLIERCLSLRRLEEDNRRHARHLEAELDSARAFQQGMLPPAEARVEGVQVACRYVPCSELGGDFYDYARAGRGKTALLVADVAGHGVSAAMLTGIVKSAFRSAAADGYEPLAVVQRTWDALQAFDHSHFVTLVAARVTPRERRLEIVNAGHPAPFLWTGPNPPVEIGSTGLIVSPALTDTVWDKKELPFEPGARLLFYTDGVPDVRSAAGSFGDERIRAAIRAHPGGGAALLDGLLHAVREFSGGRPQPDDLTLLTAGVG